jgi:DNA-directed RNA polymerase I, II, and III subunit RPABC4
MGLSNYLVGQMFYRVWSARIGIRSSLATARHRRRSCEPSRTHSRADDRASFTCFALRRGSKARRLETLKKFHRPSCDITNQPSQQHSNQQPLTPPPQHNHNTITTMSREQYQPPATGSQTDFGTTGASNTGFQASGSGFEDTQRPVHYLCGDCDNKVTLKRGDPIRCKECGYRVLYKERTNR